MRRKKWFWKKNQVTVASKDSVTPSIPWPLLGTSQPQWRRCLALTATGSWEMERKTAGFKAFVKRNTTHSSCMSLHQFGHWSIVPRGATTQWGTELTLEVLPCLPANTHTVQLMKLRRVTCLGSCLHTDKKTTVEWKQFTGKILAFWDCAGKKSTMNLLPNKLSKTGFLLVALHESHRVSKKKIKMGSYK